MAMNILYATDGSECARRAGRLLTALPLAADTRVNVLGVMPLFDWVESPLFAEWSAQEEKAAYQHVDETAARLGEHGVSADVTVRRGSAADVILDQAEADEADLVVVGSHGRGGMERFLIGSVSERVARYARTSVLVARGDNVRQAIVAVDGTEASEHALSVLTRLPLPVEMRLTIVHVIPEAAPEAPVSLIPSQRYEQLVDKYESERRDGAQQIAGQAERRLREAGRAPDVQVRCGNPAEQLLAAARETGADLVVVGSANRSALGRLFLGSVSSRVLSHAPCSVLVARSAELPSPERLPALPRGSS
jgi:nucleotide-binding universal stress UspA family protein